MQARPALLLVNAREAPAPPSTAEPHVAARLPGDPDVWIFIVAELFMFGAFFVTYALYRGGEVELFNASQMTLDRRLGVLNTLFLLTSSWAVASAVEAARRNEIREAPRGLSIAIALATAFVVVKIFEYTPKFAHNITMTTNTFYMFYFSLTLIHLVHVVGGTVILAVVLKNARRGSYRAGQTRGLETGASYWHMVDVLWIFLFALLSLLR